MAGKKIPYENLNINRRLNDLRERYSQVLPDKIERLESAREQFISAETGEPMVAELRSLAHGLAGSGAAFGYEEMGTHAGELLALLHDETRWSGAKAVAATKEVGELIASIRRASRKQGPAPAIAPTIEGNPRRDRNRLVFLVEDDKELAQDLAEQLGRFEYDTRIFNHPRGVEKSALLDQPAAIIMDIIFGREESAGLEAGAKLHGNDDQAPPMVFISARDDLETRLRAVHAGGTAYFSKPLNVSALVEKLDELTIREKKHDYRVIIIEDDELLGEHYELLLREAGMRAELLTRPAGLFHALENGDADLILMDYQLGGHLGTEIMRVLKQHERWSGIPVILISSTVDEKRQMEALLTGGEIFLKKPIAPSVLLKTVHYRADKARTTRERLRNDGLSGLLNHNAVKAELSRLRVEARRSGKGLSIAMVDIDEFKIINDSYGHAVGDRVIQCISRLFKERLGEEHAAGRYGGEEFLLLMPGYNARKARELVDEIRLDFAQLRQLADDGREFYATMSAGITETDGSHRDDIVLKAADEALYRSKSNGRNQCTIGSLATGRP